MYKLTETVLDNNTGEYVFCECWKFDTYDKAVGYKHVLNEIFDELKIEYANRIPKIILENDMFKYEIEYECK